MPGELNHRNASGINLHEGKRHKAPVRVASTATITLATPGATIDGVTMVSGDRFLAKNQSTATQNGIYVWNGASTAASRATDAASSADFVQGFIVFVLEGTANAGTYWAFTQAAAFTLGTTTPTFGRIAGSVSSVGLTAPGFEFTVTGSPVTGSGTLGFAWALENPNTILAGPVSGAADVPFFRALDPLDLPSRGGVLLRLSGDQSITTATPTVLSWGTEDQDSNAQHFTSTANLTGTVAKTASSASLVGTSTLFTSELAVGQVISVPGTAAEVRVVTAIADNTHLTVSGAFANSASGQTAARAAGPIVFRTAGLYLVTLGILWDTSATGNRTAEIRLNGTTILAGQGPYAAAASQEQALSRLVKAAQWDYVEALVTQTSGGSINAKADQRTAFGCVAQ